MYDFAFQLHHSAMENQALCIEQQFQAFGEVLQKVQDVVMFHHTFHKLTTSI